MGTKNAKSAPAAVPRASIPKIYSRAFGTASNTEGKNLPDTNTTGANNSRGKPLKAQRSAPAAPASPDTDVGGTFWLHGAATKHHKNTAHTAPTTSHQDWCLAPITRLPIPVIRRNATTPTNSES